MAENGWRPRAADINHHSCAVESDLVCRRCGYNLRGLSIPGRCPECHAELALSISGNQLRYCSPDWVMRLGSGMNWLCIAVAISVIFLATSEYMRVIHRQAIAAEIRLVASLVVAVLALNGIARVTARDPAGDETNAARRARWILRMWVIGSMALQVAGDAIATSTLAWRYGLYILQFVLGVIGVFVFFLHARQLANRIPDRKLADDTLLTMWGVVSSYVLLAVLAIGAMTPGGFPNPIALIGLSCTVLVGCVVFSIWSIGLLLRYRGALQRAARESRQTWHPQSPAELDVNAT